MATTLTLGVTTLTLDPDMLWEDEFKWKPVEQKTAYTITGALIVESMAKLAGKPITLSGGWLARSVLDTLTTWAAIPGQTMTLSLRGVDHTVVFDHENVAVDAQPIIDYAEPDAADQYAVTLRFLKV